MKKFVLSAITALFVSPLAAFSAGAADQPTAVGAEVRTVVIGYQLPLTGDRSQYGEVFRNSARLQLDKFNKEGGIPGLAVSIRFEDSKDDAKEAVALANSFSDDPQVLGVLGDFSSTASMAAGAVYGRAHVPQLSQSASHPDFLSVSPWQFRNIITQATEGAFNAAWIAETGAKTVSVIAIQNDWGLSAAENFVKTFKEKGGAVVSTEYFNPGTRDFRPILTKIARANPDAVYLGMFYEEGAALLQQARQLGIKSAFFSASPLYAPKLIDLAGGAADGLRLSTSFVPDDPSPLVSDYVAAYKARYGAVPNMFAAQGYDAAGIMLAALRVAGPGVTRDSLRQALAATRDYPGVTGTTSFDPETREPVKGLSRLKVENGAFVQVKD